MSVNQYPNEGQQKKSGTGTCLKVAGIGCLVIIVAVVGFGLFAYNKLGKDPQFRNVFQQSQSMGRCVANLGIVAQGLKRYTADHGGQYPAKLADLYPKYVTDQAQLQCPTSAQVGMVCPYEYTRPSPNAPQSTVVLVCRHPSVVKGQPPLLVRLRKSGKVDAQQQVPQQTGPQPTPQPVPTKP